MISSNTMFGVGVRWSDVEVDISDAIGDVQTRGLQYLFTVTQGF